MRPQLRDTPARRGRAPTGGQAGRRRPVVFLTVWAAVILLALLGLGWLLSKVATGNDIAHTDDSLTRWLVTRRTPTWTDTAGLVTTLSDTITVVVIAALAVVVARLAFKRWREPLMVVVAVVGEVLIFLALTMLVERQRPAVPQLDEAPPTSSYPSGHTAAAIVLYGSLAVIALRWVRRRGWRAVIVAIAVAIPAAIALARVYLGMHYVTDVLGGAVLGVAWLTVAARGVLTGAVGSPTRRPERRA